MLVLGIVLAIASVIVLILLIIYRHYELKNSTDPMITNKEKINATFNKCNKSWHQDGYSKPSESQIYKNNIQLYKNWDSYWNLVDMRKVEPIRDPIEYYSLNNV
jgi:hypothetical protein